MASLPSQPVAGLVQGGDGNFYGTTTGSSFGKIFRMTPAGALTVIVSFTGAGGANNGSNPRASLVRGSDGNFYGTTCQGGAGDFGTVFRVTPAGALATLVEFTGAAGANRGSYPEAGLVQGSDGNFYGTTLGGGASFAGTIFRLTPGGALTTLVEFTGVTGANKGQGPAAALVPGNDGFFYGTTSSGGASDRGTVFRVTPAGVLTTLVEFTGATGANRGDYPVAALVRASDGNFYGTTQFGGPTDQGTVFRVTPAGALTTLVEFTGGTGGLKGRHPTAGLMQGPDGFLYGTTEQGGASDRGTIFRLTTAGSLTTLVEFTGVAGANRGAAPEDALVLGSDGNLYGTTFDGGQNGSGTVFRLRLDPAAPVAQLVGITFEPGVGVRIRGQGVAGQTYQVQFNPTLTAAWQTVAGTVTAGAGGGFEYLDTTLPPPGKRFYRAVGAP